MRAIRFPAAGLAALTLSALVMPSVAAQPNDYDRCLDLVAQDPERAEAEAAHWAGFGGGWPARHCRALALEAMGSERPAAAALVELAAEAADLPQEARIEILHHAGEIFLRLGDTASGHRVTAEALRLRQDAATHTLRARLHAEDRNWAAAIAELDAALARAPATAERVTLRASARRRAGQAASARADALWALELEPGNPLALLELGAAEAALGHLDPARRALADAIAADTEGTIAGFARRRLQQLEAGG